VATVEEIRDFDGSRRISRHRREELMLLDRLRAELRRSHPTAREEQ
jgi:hypothetical protein